MKYLVTAILCLMAGYLFGRWAPQSKLQTQKQEVENIREQVKKEARDGRGLRGVSQILQIERTPFTTNVVEKIVVITNEVNVVVTNTVNERVRERDNRDMRSRIDAAKEVWETRVDIARRTFLDKVDANRETRREFNGILQGMNMHMRVVVNDWAAEMEQYDDVYPDDSLKLMENVIGAMGVAYKRMDETMPENWRESAGKDFNLFDLIDPSVGEGLIKLEGRGVDF